MQLVLAGHMFIYLIGTNPFVLVVCHPMHVLCLSAVAQPVTGSQNAVGGVRCGGNDSATATGRSGSDTKETRNGRQGLEQKSNWDIISVS